MAQDESAAEKEIWIRGRAHVKARGGKDQTSLQRTTLIYDYKMILLEPLHHPLLSLSLLLSLNYRFPSPLSFPAPLCWPSAGHVLQQLAVTLRQPQLHSFVSVKALSQLPQLWVDHFKRVRPVPCLSVRPKQDSCLWASTHKMRMTAMSSEATPTRGNHC